LFFLVPYLRWNGKQAILFDIEHRQFHFFNLMVPAQISGCCSLLLLLLADGAVCSDIGSVACMVRLFLFSDCMTDWFTWIEEKIEGAPSARRKLDAAPWNLEKIAKKSIKHFIWMLISLLTRHQFFPIWFVMRTGTGIRCSGSNAIRWVTLITIFSALTSCCVAA